VRISDPVEVHDQVARPGRRQYRPVLAIREPGGGGYALRTCAAEPVTLGVADSTDRNSALPGGLRKGLRSPWSRGRKEQALNRPIPIQERTYGVRPPYDEIIVEGFLSVAEPSFACSHGSILKAEPASYYGQPLG